MIDILYLGKGREEFTEESVEALHINTSWPLVDRLAIYTDGAPICNAFDQAFPVRQAWVNSDTHGGPVAIMNHFLSLSGAPIFAKIDCDVMVPRGWLDAALAVMEANPKLDFLGLEPPASRTPNPATPGRRLQAPELIGESGGFTHSRDLHFGYAPADSVGGVGLFRRSAFEGRAPMVPYANGRGGFGDWQLKHPEVVKGWIVPPLKLFLLDRLPFEPWLSYSRQYNASGIQRPWTNYDPADADALWSWWKP